MINVILSDVKTLEMYYMKRNKLKLLTRVATNLKRIREEKNLTINELSKKTGINKNYLKKIEADNAPRLCLSKVMKTVSALDIDYKELFT